MLVNSRDGINSVKVRLAFDNPITPIRKRRRYRYGANP
jgi:hypothetical protein